MIRKRKWSHLFGNSQRNNAEGILHIALSKAQRRVILISFSIVSPPAQIERRRDQPPLTEHLRLLKELEEEIPLIIESVQTDSARRM